MGRSTWLMLALAGWFGCAGGSGDDDDDDDETEDDSDDDGPTGPPNLGSQPLQEGHWTDDGDAVLIEDDCGLSADSIEDPWPGFTLDWVDDDTFQIVLDSEITTEEFALPSTYLCVATSSSFSCEPETETYDLTSQGLSVELTYIISHEGTFASSTEMTLETTFTISCEGVDCAAVEDAGLDMPCAFTVLGIAFAD